MSTTNAAVADGRPRRKSLSDQLDRLDGIVDDLSEGLSVASQKGCRHLSPKFW